MQRPWSVPLFLPLALVTAVAASQDAPMLRVTGDPPARSFVVGETCDFRITWELLQPLAGGSEIRILTPREGGWSRPSLDPQQEETPGQYGLVQYRLLKAADPAAKLVGRTEKWSDRGPPYTQQDRISQFVMQLEGGALSPGDQGEIVFPGARTSRTALHPDAERNVTGYRVQVQPAGQEEWQEIEGLPQYRMLPGEPHHLYFRAPSQVVKGEPFTLAVAVMDQFGNPVHEFIGGATLKSSHPEARLPQAVEFRAEDKGTIAIQGIELATPGSQTITVTAGIELPTSQTATCQIEVLAQAPPLRLFWGELHNHGMLSYDARNWGGCTMRPADAYWYARRIENLDFAAVTDHSMHNGRLTQQNMTEEEFIECQQAAKMRHDPGKFVTFTAVEQRCARGDTNTYFLNDDEVYYMKEKPITVQEMWGFYRASPIVTIPHLHPQIKRPERFDEIDPEKERLIEIHSNHGRYEYHENQPLFPRKGMVEGNNVQAILARGHRLGIVAASDDHSGRPGIRDVTGIYATERTRPAIFEAMRARHTFGTTGARMNIEFRMGEHMMGDDVRVKPDDPLWQSRRFSARIVGTDRVSKVEVVRSSKVIYSVAPGERVVEFEYADMEPLADGYLGTEINNPATAYYYLRISQQPEGAEGEQGLHMAWTSPIFISPAG